jgi:hypothetical protein
MKNDIFQLFFLLLIATFSLIWISDKVSVIMENEKYDYFETTEKSDIENQTENKLKTQFVDSIELLNLTQLSLSHSKNNNTYYFFTIKETSFENLTPPPEQA